MFRSRASKARVPPPPYVTHAPRRGRPAFEVPGLTGRSQAILAVCVAAADAARRARAAACSPAMVAGLRRDRADRYLHEDQRYSVEAEVPQVMPPGHRMRCAKNK